MPHATPTCPHHATLMKKAAEAGGHADELRQLLGALDFNGYFAARE